MTTHKNPTAVGTTAINRLDSATARAMLREKWGNSTNLTTADHRWLDGCFPKGDPHHNATAIEKALRVAGWWDDYVASNQPTWAAFRDWLKNHN